MEYKIYKVIYNDGGYHSGALPSFFYIAKNVDELIANSKRYAQFLESKKISGGDIWVHEFNGVEFAYDWENLKDFEINISVKRK